MNKKQLKEILKPLIKECIKEVMFEDGVLSGIISEVTTGLRAAQIVESQPQSKSNIQSDEARQRSIREQKEKFNAHKKKLLDAIGKDSYNGINLFEGTSPLSSGGPAPGAPIPYEGPLAHVEATDQGVNIDGLFGAVGKHWKAHVESGK